MLASEIYGFINCIAPFSSAAPWDNSGFLVGDKQAEITKALVCLDVTNEEILQAEKEGAELIISHHPVIFTPIKSLTVNQPVYEAVKRGIAVISAHTNLDKAVNGVNDTLCRVLEMDFSKLSEEVGEGFLNVGTLPFEGNAQKVGEYIREKLGGAVRYCDGGKVIKKVAVCSGSGGDLFNEALACGCDALITGDASYHDFLDSKTAGVSLFAAGHYETESIVVSVLADTLSAQFPGIAFIQSQRKNPIITIK